MDNHCLDCGRPTQGVRCRVCNGRFIRESAARAKARDDAELLNMFDAERLSYARLGARLGITRMGALYRVRKARARQKVRLGLIH
jgi:hypothetical protein